MPERAFFRIEFGDGEHPTLVVDGHPYEVTNVSEEGVCFLLGDGPVPEPEDRLRGVLHLIDLEPIEVAGRVVWIRGDQSALFLDELRIPLRVILGEQLALRRRYVTWGDPFAPAEEG